MTEFEDTCRGRTADWETECRYKQEELRDERNKLEDTKAELGRGRKPSRISCDDPRRTSRTPTRCSKASAPRKLSSRSDARRSEPRRMRRR